MKFEKFENDISFQADARVSRPENLKEVCDSIDAKLFCLEANVGKCLNSQGKQNIRYNYPSNISTKAQLEITKEQQHQYFCLRSEIHGMCLG